MKKQTLTIISFVITATFSSPAVVAKNDHTKGHKSKPQHAEKTQRQENRAASSHRDSQDRGFSIKEHELIRDYYDRHRYDSGRTTLPKGLQKKYQRTGELPPGWQKKLNRGQVLPKDIYHYGHELPVDLRRSLPLGPVGSKVIKVEGRIIRLMESTREIVDILDIGQ